MSMNFEAMVNRANEQAKRYKEINDQYRKAYKEKASEDTKSDLSQKRAEADNILFGMLSMLDAITGGDWWCDERIGEVKMR